MQKYYDHTSIEKEAQSSWSSSGLHKASEFFPLEKKNFKKTKFYACSMLPYPSGKLHMGHVRNYTINDVMVRQLRMKNFNVLMPMGWDAFGMPAENAAIMHGISPYKWTKNNIEHMKKQLLTLGLSIDWSRELLTCDPQYYKWNQWIFLKMLKCGIAYRKTQVVNWDPIDQTVLSKEQVINGRGWRSGAIIQKREIPGYYLRITKYADELLQSAEKLNGWPEQVISMQKNWIGKSEGIRFFFPHCIRNTNGDLIQNGSLYVFTTRPDTIMGVTFCAISPEHPLASHAAKMSFQIASFVRKIKQNSIVNSSFEESSIEGIYSGLTVTHPLTGKIINVWISNYVRSDYGDGAIMGVPGHDKSDFFFAKKHNIPIIQVNMSEGKSFESNHWKDWYSEKSYSHTINSLEFSNLNYREASEAIVKTIQNKKFGEKYTTYRLRDWSISRQRYWGTPIPLIHCKTCGLVPVPEKELPVVLPTNLVPDGTGNPLNKNELFLSCFCPICKQDAKRETDTMDTFFDSSWYFMRYTSPGSKDCMLDERNNYWMPVDQYIGGIEHAILHLLYARFWTKAMRDMGLINLDEPFKKVLCQGMVLNHTYSRTNREGKKEYFSGNQIECIYDENSRIIKAKLKTDQSLIDYDGMISMSKSKFNGIDPQSIIETYGADTARLFIIFSNSPERNIEWSNSGINGTNRFLHRIWNICYKKIAVIKNNQHYQEIDWNQSPEIVRNFRRNVYYLLEQADRDYRRVHYNTVVSATMKLANIIEDISNFKNHYFKYAITESIGILLRVLYPIVPHITWKLWLELGYKSVFGEISDSPWPEIDKTAIDREEIELILQINGKYKGKFLVPKESSHEKIKSIAVIQNQSQRFLSGKLPKRIILVPKKLVNIVT